MRPKLFLLFICLIGLIGCLPAREPVAVTRPVLVTEVPTGVSTAVPPTNTPLPTATQVAAATAAPTTTPLPTSTPEPAWPTTPILFVRDGALQRWLPQTNEVELLVEGVDGYRVYAPNFAVFMREVVPQETFALIVFHIPTRTEVEVLRLPATETTNISTGEPSYYAPVSSITVSPNGRWLAYVLPNEDTDTFTLFAHEIQVANKQVLVGHAIFSSELSTDFSWPYDKIFWPTANELSWTEPDGVWIANLNETPITSDLAILASTNMILVHPNPMISEDQDQEPYLVSTTYIPYQWSPGGRFLLAKERFPIEGWSTVFQIIERGSNNKFQLPDSALGGLSDDAVWLDETHILHFRLDGLIRIWQIVSEGELLPLLKSEFEVVIPNSDYLEARNLLPLPNNHLRFNDITLYNRLYDLDLTTQELFKIGDNGETGSRQHFWSPTGQYALWIANPNQGETQVLLDLLNGEPQVDMTQIFGLDSCCWYWESPGSE